MNWRCVLRLSHAWVEDPTALNHGPPGWHCQTCGVRTWRCRTCGEHHNPDHLVIRIRR